MTIKEISDVFGVDKTTVIKHVRELFPNAVQHGKTTELNEGQVAALSIRMKDKALVGRPSNITEMLTVENFSTVPVTKKESVMQMANAIQSFVDAFKSYCDNTDAEVEALTNEVKVLKAKLGEVDGYASIMRVTSIIGDTSPDGRKITYKPLRDAMRDLELDIKKYKHPGFPQELNLYHKDAWMAAYGVDIMRL